MAAYADEDRGEYPDMWCEMPDSHHGILPPAVKKSAAFLTRRFDHQPMPIMTRK